MLRNNALLVSKQSEKEKKNILQAKKKKSKWFKQQNKMIVQKDGLHFAVRHNAHGLQGGTVKNYDKCLCVLY